MLRMLIRDEIAASKKKGMWMGGVPPLGYQAQDRKLVIVEGEAEIVRFIFCRCAELGSVRLLKDELEARSIQSKLRTSASGRPLGGKPFARGALYLILRNRIYHGEIVHNEEFYLGEHEPIIDQPLWDAVQAQLASNTAQRADSGKTRQPSLLAGMLFDGDGNRMTPSHAVKKGTRYRYYVSRSLITKDRTADSAGLRVTAASTTGARSAVLQTKPWPISTLFPYRPRRQTAEPVSSPADASSSARPVLSVCALSRVA
jgi:hypothetical protein